MFWSYRSEIRKKKTKKKTNIYYPKWFDDWTIELYLSPHPNEYWITTIVFCTRSLYVKKSISTFYWTLWSNKDCTEKEQCEQEIICRYYQHDAKSLSGQCLFTTRWHFSPSLSYIVGNGSQYIVYERRS